MMDIKEFLVKKLTEISDISNCFQETICLNDFQEENTEKEVIEVSREVVIDYLVKSGYELTNDNFNQAEKMLLSMEADKRSRTLSNAGKTKELTTINHLDELSIEELNSLLNIAVLNVLDEIKDKKNVRYKYVVETIKDVRGGTDAPSLKSVLKKYGDMGYKAISIFTNELGKNSASIGTSVGTFGVNSTADEVVVVFEKIIYD